MIADTYEVEQKFRLVDDRPFQAALLELGARREMEVEQIDWYFDHPTQHFAQTDEALRLRCCGDQNRVTYKGPKLDALTKTRQEIEVELASGEEAAANFHALMIALGFHYVDQVRKTRHEFVVIWQQHPIHIALDELPDLGRFVELEESQVPESNLDAARQRIASLASHLGLQPDDGERRSYLELRLASRAERGDSGTRPST
jgi:adenylate cyclase class 2